MLIAISDGIEHSRRCRHDGTHRRGGASTLATRPVPSHRTALPGPVIEEIRTATREMAHELRVRRLMNVQYAVKKEDDGVNVYVLEVNPRASRTVPFVSKATGVPVARIAAKVMTGVSLAEQGCIDDPVPAHVSVKESVFPFAKFAGVDIVLGPEMKSTGEVMGTSKRFSIAFAKGQLAAGVDLPGEGTSSSAWPIATKSTSSTSPSDSPASALTCWQHRVRLG